MLNLVKQLQFFQQFQNPSKKLRQKLSKHFQAFTILFFETLAQGFCLASKLH